MDLNLASLAHPPLQVRRGLGDRAPAVRAEVGKLVMQWLEDSCEGEPLRLVHQLDVQRHPGKWWVQRVWHCAGGGKQCRSAAT